MTDPETVSRLEDSPSRLQVGALVDGDIQPAWIAHALGQVAGSPHADLALVVITPSPGTGGTSPGVGSRLRDTFFRLDRRLFRRQPDPLAPSPIDAVVEGAAVITLPNARTVDDATRERVQAAGLDVIISFVVPQIARQFVDSAQHGVWFYPDLFGPDGEDRPVGLGAVVAARPAVSLSLANLTAEGGAGHERYHAVSAVNRLSPHYTERRLLWAMANFPVRALATLARDGDTIAAGTRERVPAPDRIPPLPVVVARYAWRLATHARQSATTRTEWTLAWRPEATLTLDSLTRPNPPGTYTLIENPPDRFWADPFPVVDGDRRWLFVEEFPLDAPRAHLAVMEMLDDGTLGPSTPVLTTPWHLSYPFVFPWQGDWYMVPESMDNRTVDLYRSTRFPFEWEHAQRLMDDVRVVDTTLVEIGDRWWMFATVAPHGGTENDELHIHHASTPLGPWTPHPRNPLLVDVRRARPAGRIFELDGQWYRPSQDCSRRYGYAMTINRITELSETAYAETVVARIEPTWAQDLLGTHTFNHGGGVTFVDGDLRRSRLPVRR